jgi:Tfp pilus assembly protein PilV
MKTHRANTYDLIVAAELEDKGRSVIETLIYALFIAIAVVSIVSAAAQSVTMPSRVAVKECKAQSCA